MYNRRFTPEKVTELKSNEIFVFGSNIEGYHDGGAAFTAYSKFGAVLRQGEGLQGQSYAIPTMQGGVEAIRPYVDRFIEFASAHPELDFLVTRIGCGTAGFSDREIAPLFQKAVEVENIILPWSFVIVLQPQLVRGKTEVATKDSWETRPMPELHAVIPMRVSIPSSAMRIVKMGHIPHRMEDHWFMYCDTSTIQYYRSWSGICIFIATYEDDGINCKITELQVNRDSAQYQGDSNTSDMNLFMALLTDEYGGDAHIYWERALGRLK